MAPGSSAHAGASCRPRLVAEKTPPWVLANAFSAQHTLHSIAFAVQPAQRTLPVGVSLIVKGQVEWLVRAMGLSVSTIIRGFRLVDDPPDLIPLRPIERRAFDHAVYL